MNKAEIQEYVDGKYPELRLQVRHIQDGPGTIEIMGRIQYGFFQVDSAHERVVDEQLRAQMEGLIDLATRVIDRMKVKNGVTE